MFKIKTRKLIILLFSYIALVLLGLKYSEEITDFKAKVYYHFSNAGIMTAPNKQETQNNTGEFYSNSNPFIYRGTEWFINSPLISHACGGINGLAYSNSKEALDYTLTNGNRIVEVDFSYTADNRLVCFHDWKTLEIAEPLDYSSFMEMHIFDRYTALDANDIVDYMVAYPDLYIVIDTKDNLLDVIDSLIELCDSSKVLDRFIVQLYDRHEKELILQKYHFPEENFLFTAYKYTGTTQEIYNLCIDENIRVLTIPYSYLSNDELQHFLKTGFIIYEHTVNDPSIANDELMKGIHGIYTDFLSENALIQVDAALS